MKKIIRCLCYAFILSSFSLPSSSFASFSSTEGATALQNIHNELWLMHGSFAQEYPEQLMAVRFIPPNANVLELGGNIGRNSCVIAKILHDSMNLVTLESSPIIAKQLQENRDLNNLYFFIEAAAISHVPLIQHGWNTTPSTDCPSGYFSVETTTLDELQKKYAILFNVLVADCEGALYQILKDDPTFLTNIELILVENDYHNDPDGMHYQFTKKIFEQNGLQLIYTEPGPEWARHLFPATIDQFYQVWAKI